MTISEMTGFAAGTLVHTKEGLRAIEEIKVGDYVLSKPENGGELAYKRVSKTFVRENTEVWGVIYEIYTGRESGRQREALLVTTAEHPFWVSTLRVKDPNQKFGGMNIPHNQWVTPEEMFIIDDNYFKRKGESARHYLSTYDGKEYGVVDAAPICMAWDKPARNAVYDFSGPAFGVLWPVSPDTQREADGRGIDFRLNTPVLLALPPPHTHLTTGLGLNKKTRNTDKASWVTGTTEHITRGYQPKRCTVYNLEVEDFHTYFVGEHGICVHNTCQAVAPRA